MYLHCRRGADRSIRDNDELTAMEHAEVRGHTECAHVLYNYGVRRPSSALSVASQVPLLCIQSHDFHMTCMQVSVQTLPPPSLDKHGHVTLALPQRRFSLSHSSLPADGQDHPDNSDIDHTHERVSYPHTLQQVHTIVHTSVNHTYLLGTDLQECSRERRQWWRLLCGCNRRNNVVMPTSVT